MFFSIFSIADRTRFYPELMKYSYFFVLNPFHGKGGGSEISRSMETLLFFLDPPPASPSLPPPPPYISPEARGTVVIPLLGVSV